MNSELCAGRCLIRLTAHSFGSRTVSSIPGKPFSLCALIASSMYPGRGLSETKSVASRSLVRSVRV